MRITFLAAIPLVTSIALASFYFEFKENTQSNTSLASSKTVSFATKYEKIQQNIAKIKSEIPQSKSYTTGFLNSVIQAYEWLMEQKNKDRYFFLYSVVESLSISNTVDRHESIKLLLDAEMSRFKRDDFSYSEDEAWVGIVKNLKQTSTQMMEFETKSQALTKSHLASIDKLQREISDFKMLSENSVAKLAIPKETSRDTSAEMIIILMGVIGTLATLLKKNKAQPESPVSTEAIKDKFNYFEVKVNPEPGVNLEDVCNANFANLSHIIKASDLKISTKRKVPTTDRLLIQDDVIHDAVHSLLKGTLVLAQNETSETNISLEWSYDINPKRAQIEFQLNGKEYTLGDLERNHQLLQDSSIASQFASAQNKLSNYRPVIQVQPKDGHTKITLSLDTNPTSVMTVH
jgi:hypothetical protein